MSIVPTTKDVPKNPAIRRAWVCLQLRVKGDSLAAIGRRIGASQQALSNALMTPSARCEQAIAEALGMPVQELFPERFDPSGNRIPQIRRPQPSTGGEARNVQQRGAA